LAVSRQFVAACDVATTRSTTLHQLGRRPAAPRNCREP